MQTIENAFITNFYVMLIIYMKLHELSGPDITTEVKNVDGSYIFLKVLAFMCIFEKKIIYFIHF